jgi:hypothetical protein
VRLGLEYEQAVLRWFKARPWEDTAARPETTREPTTRRRRPTPSR